MSVIENIRNLWNHKSIIQTQQNKINSLKEQLSLGGQLWLNNIVSGKGTFNSNVLQDIYGEKLMTPHEEMLECRRFYDTNTNVVSAVNAASKIILGENLSVDANKTTQRFFENMFDETKFVVSLAESVENFKLMGNGYLEKLKRVLTGEVGDFDAITRPANIYIDIQKGELKRYIYYMPNNLHAENIKNFSITYMGYKRNIRGIEIPPERLIHLKEGMGAYSEYGRGPLASASSDNKIMREIERSWAIIAKYKAVGKKIIRFTDSEGNDINDTERRKQVEFMRNTDDFENITVNRKVEIQDLDYGGAEVNMQPCIDHLKTKSTGAIIPSFYIYADATRYQTSGDQKDIFMLQIINDRDTISRAINPLLKQIALTEGLDTKVKLKFGKFSFMSEQEKIRLMLEEWKNGTITLNEYRVGTGKDKVKPEEGGDDFKKPSANPFDSMNGDNQNGGNK